MKPSIFFNAHHSPVGSFATFTLGSKGPRGGLGLELTGPANESVFVGAEDLNEPNLFRALPFYGGSENQAADYDVENLNEVHTEGKLIPFADDQITREFGAGIDEWKAGDLTLRIVSPPKSVPNPDETDVKDEVTPGVIVELTLDNSLGKRARKAFFGYGGSDRSVGMRILDSHGLTGVGQGNTTAIACADPDVYAGLAWQPEVILCPKYQENLAFMLGSIGLLVGTVEPGEVRTFTFAVCFFREGQATTGIATRYLYRRWFNSLEEVASHTLRSATKNKQLAEEFDANIKAQLSPERAFMVSHAIKSYFGATQLLEREDHKPLWVVHEGEYRMMNTFDLTIDQTFFELRLNPWTVKNVLDLFVEKYSYEDRLRFPGDPTTYSGGISFTHDMGVSNAFSKQHYSAYEQVGLTGCFSYMSSEELMNWILTAGLYATHTNDTKWVKDNQEIFARCFASLQNRDNPDPNKRNGVMSLDGDRCLGGAEITTYDSLDESLGQARNNLYLAVKGWASYLTLEKTFASLGDTNAAMESRLQAERAAKTICDSADADGLLPAVIGEGFDARIIPAIEALVYPHYCGIDTAPYQPLIEVLKKHFKAVLKPGVCKFADGGWKLSSTSNNSWLSKIYLCQYVAENILGFPADSLADKAHEGWLLDEENSYYAWSDQMLSGKAVGSKYYPRGVTSILWLKEG